jgi:uncharacterized delta-60 repeat protein
MSMLAWGMISAVALIAVAAAPAAAAKPRPGQLDRGFGTRGLVTAPREARAPFGHADTPMGRDPDGQLVVAVPEGQVTTVVRYLSDGSPDPSFGKGGRVVLQVPGKSPDTRFDAAGLAVEKDGRIVIAGNLVQQGECTPRCGLALLRLRADGALDPSFGQGGVATPDFGFPAVPVPARTSLSGVPGPESGPATSSAMAIRIDDAGRIVVSGTVITAYRYGKNELIFPVSSPLVSRLLPDGSVDPTFGLSGAAVLGELEGGKPTDLAIDSGERPLVSVCSPLGDGLVLLGAAGAREPGFGSEGTAALGGCPQAIALDRADRIVLLVREAKCHYAVGRVCPALLSRLGSSGTLDDHFGHGGWVRPHRSSGRVPVWQDLAIDGRGRIDLAGVLAGRSNAERERLVSVALEVSRRTAGGAVDSGFGGRGRTAIGLPGLHGTPSQPPAHLLLSPGRVLVGSSYLKGESEEEQTVVAGFRGG